MLVEVTQSYKVSHDIELPYYSGNEYHFFKIINENLTLKVFIGHNNGSADVELSEYLVKHAVDSDYSPITEAQFNEKFNIALEILKSKI